MRTYWRGLALFAIGAAAVAAGHGITSPWTWAPLIVAVPFFGYAYITLKRSRR